MYDSETECQPAHHRAIRRGGLMVCCLRMIRHTIKITKPGDTLQCDVCKALVVVDQAGAWVWEPAMNLIEAQRRREVS